MVGGFPLHFICYCHSPLYVDIQFWQKEKTFEGLSLRSIVLNVFLQLIVFLYLLDNDTSWIILLSNGVGLLIELWKIRKACKVIFDRQTPSIRIPFLNLHLLPFSIVIAPSHPSSQLRKKTDEYDALAFHYLSILCLPLLFGYSVYSLYYETHKSWYSWCINTAVGFVYTFGFIGMTPQLFINYKLKSVAHMPWKTFMYKVFHYENDHHQALNTFIDDLFAFIIRMPMLHRIACFRDDLIFVVYLYQKWAYPVDKNRANEYGQVGESQELDTQKKNE